MNTLVKPQNLKVKPDSGIHNLEYNRRKPDSGSFPLLTKIGKVKNSLLVLLLSFLILTRLAEARAKQVGVNEHKQVIICFDDGYYAIYKYAYPILKRYNIPITSAFITSYVTPGRPRHSANSYLYMNQGEIQEMIDSIGMEVASHSVIHRDLTKLDDVQAKYELTNSKKILDSLFKQDIITFVYPYGRVNHRIIDLTKASGYKLGRTIRWGEPNLWVDKFLIPIKEVRMSTSIQEVLKHIKHHNTTVLLFHRILPQPSVFTEWSQSQFNQLLAALTKEEIEFVTLKDLYLKWWQETMTKYLAQKGWLQTNNAVLFQKIDVDKIRTFYPHISQ